MDPLVRQSEKMKAEVVWPPTLCTNRQLTNHVESVAPSSGVDAQVEKLPRGQNHAEPGVAATSR